MKQNGTILFILSLFITIGLVGCGGKSNLETAKKHYEKMEYNLAKEAYIAVYSNDKDKENKKQASYGAAESYRMINDMKNAENWYKKAIKAGYSDPEAKFRYAQALKANQKYTEAIIEFQNYKKAFPGDTNVDKEIRGAELALQLRDAKTRYVVEPIKPLNTKFSDFAPMYFKKDGLLFTSDRENGASKKTYQWTGNMHTDIYQTTYKKDRKTGSIKYTAPLLVEGEINTDYNDGTCAFGNRGATMYYTQCNDKDGKGNVCKIYMANMTGKVWGAPELLPFNSDSFNCGHPAVTEDGSKLYFSSDMEGGYGGKDIYVVNYVKRSKTWSDPINLGPTINTAGDDMYPFIHEDGTLYFSSNGHVGLGGQDIFMAKGTGNEWSEPVNMKSPLNSGGDDFALVLDQNKEEGFFTSNRDGGRGLDDIYRFYMTPLAFTLSGIARDVKTNEILPNTIVTLVNHEDTTAKETVKTDASGYYKFTLQSRTDYSVSGSKEDYISSAVHDTTTKPFEVSMDIVQDLYLDQFCFTCLLKVEGIYYGLDSADIRPASALVLDSVVMVLRQYPKIRIELGSHTDCRSDSLYNINLSQRRADSAVNYILKKGIDSARIFAKGYGENQLEIAKCKCEGPDAARQAKECTEEEHQLNRRTTVRIMDNKYVPKVKEEPVDPKGKKKAPVKPGARPAPGAKPPVKPK